jgi:type VI secretion system secreted protein Hcp
MQDFHFVMRLNRASIGLMKACATGQHIKEATLSARKAGKQQQEYLALKFQEVLISSYQTGGSEGGDIVPTDQVSFNFAKIDVEYRPQKADGSLDVGIHFKYDIKANKPL